MSTHPLLDERDQRRRRPWITAGVMFALVVAAAIFITMNAGRWGVPMFSFTNDHGSPCRNDWLGHSCTDLTRSDLERHLGLHLPAQARILSSHWKQTHDYELNARLIYPQDIAQEARAALTEKFGNCQEGLPSRLSELPDLSGLCVMTNEGVGQPGVAPGPRIWRIATATQADGDTMVDIQLRSR